METIQRAIRPVVTFGVVMLKQKLWLLGLSMSLGACLISCRLGSDPQAASSELSTIKIGNFGTGWAVMKIAITRAEDKLVFLDKAFPEASFNNGSSSIATKVPYNRYHIELKYYADAEQKKLMMQSCAGESSKVYDIDQPVEGIEIKICDAENAELGTTPPVQESDVSITPVLGKDPVSPGTKPDANCKPL
jgi:hypothetical protein